MAKEILIAGPGKAEREEFQKIFETTGYHLVFSDKGEDVLLKVQQLKPDLIIAGSPELCEAVKKDPGSKNIPFIFLSSIFDETPEGGRRRVPADGIISKPFYEDEVLTMVNRLTENRGSEWEEEEIIELVDVVEEQEHEPRMSIDDFVGPGKEETLGEILPLESWGKIQEEEKPAEPGFFLPPEKAEKEIFKSEEGPKETASEGDFFEKIELDEILQKVDDLKPFFEKEWAEEPGGKIREEVAHMVEKSETFKPVEKEALKSEPPRMEIEQLQLKSPDDAAASDEIPFEEIDLEALAEEAVESLPKKELVEEEFPEELVEEVMQEEAIEIPEAVQGREEIGLGPGEVRWKPEEIRPEPEGTRFGLRETGLESEKIWGEPGKGTEFKEEGPMRVFEEGVPREIEKVIAEGIRDITEEFVTKLVPQMTQNIVNLTLDRIEKMVREIVPDLAEKAIREEIQRLQKEIKR